MTAEEKDIPNIAGSRLRDCVTCPSHPDPLLSAVCYCENCRRQTGTALSRIRDEPAP